jgi:uncharacterized protein YhfF
VNYISDKYRADLANQTDITTESGCISGDFSWYSLINSNVQQGVEGAIDPAIYNQGIIRICATQSPGSGTDSKDETDSARWVEVGYCGQRNIKCWVDMESVSDVIKDLDIKEDALSDLYDNYLGILSTGNESKYLKPDVAQKDIDEIEEKRQWESEPNSVIEKVNEIIDKVFMNAQKAKLLLFRGRAYGELAKNSKGKIDNEIKKEGSPVGEDDSEEDEESSLEIIEEDEAQTETFCSSYTCIGATSTNSGLEVIGGDCQKELGQKIIEIAREIKEEEGIVDADVQADTGAKNFECLILQQAMQESCLAHCEYSEEQADYDYCDGDINSVVTGDDGNSVGVMQLSKTYFDEFNSVNVEWNIREGIKKLVSDYEKDTIRYYSCKNINYAGWNRALRYYNGWNTNCNLGDVDYVDNVLDKKNLIAGMFSECA